MTATVTPDSRTDAGRSIDEELAGLDALELPSASKAELAVRAWQALWPKIAAIGIFLFIWQCVVWSGWKPEYVLPSPAKVFEVLRDGLTNGVAPESAGALQTAWTGFWHGTVMTGVRITLTRAAIGFAIASVIGIVLGALVSRVRLLRIAVGSLLTGLQTMPSIAWFPLAILLFKLTDAAILFVVVLGAAPAIAVGLISGADSVPPVLIRAGKVLGTRRLSLYGNVILPASLPSFVGGLKQGWAFAWRSLMAGELLVIIENQPAVGFQLNQARILAEAPAVVAAMIVILVIGLVVDSVFFGTAERAIRKRWGLVDPTEGRRAALHGRSRRGSMGPERAGAAGLMGATGGGTGSGGGGGGDAA